MFAPVDDDVEPDASAAPIDLPGMRPSKAPAAAMSAWSVSAAAPEAFSGRRDRWHPPVLAACAGSPRHQAAARGGGPPVDADHDDEPLTPLMRAVRRVTVLRRLRRQSTTESGAFSTDTSVDGGSARVDGGSGVGLFDERTVDEEVRGRSRGPGTRERRGGGG
jgi:hypothetical protein